MSTPKTALIIGASRGLGLGLVKQLLQDGWDVTATVRDPSKADALKAVGPVQIEKLDMDDQQAVIALAQRLKERTFHLLFVNAGVKGTAEPGARSRHSRGSRHSFSLMPWRRSTWRSALSGRSAKTAACSHS